MSGRSATRYVLLGALGLLAAVFLALLVLTPIEIRSEAVRSFLETKLADALGGRFSYERLRVSLFPRPCASVLGVAFTKGPSLAVAVAELTVCPQLLPLLRGELRPARIRALAPDIRFSGPLFPAPAGAPADAIVPRAAQALKLLPETDVDLIDGRMTLTDTSGQVFTLQGMQVDLRHRGQELTARLRCQSNLWKHLSVKTQLMVDDLTGAIELDVADFQPAGLLAGMFPDSAIKLLEGRAELSLTVTPEGADRVRARLTGQVPSLRLAYHHREADLSIEAITAELEAAPGRLAVSIPELVTRRPRAVVSLDIVNDDSATPRIVIDLKGSVDDVAAVREAALVFLADVAEAGVVFDVVRGGKIPSIAVSARGESLDDLGRLENILIRGQMQQGRIFIPVVELDLDDVYGDVVIAGGILEGSRLRAHYRGTRGENGSLRLGLTPADSVIELDIAMHADLAPLPAILARVIPDGPFRTELRRIEAFTGTANGRLQLNGRLDHVGVRVDAADIDAGARYQRLPLPLKFTGGRFLYDGPSIEVRDLDVRVGSSTLTRLSSRLGLDGDLPLTASSPAATVELADLLRLFGDDPPLALLTFLEGTAGFQDWELAGSAADPRTWEMRSSGSVRGLHLASERLPGPVRVDQAPFVWEGRNVRAQGWTLAIGGSRMDVTTAGFDWTGVPVLDLTARRVDAAVEDLLWFLSSRPDLAAHLTPFAPLSGMATLRDAQSRVAFPPGAGARVDVSTRLDSARITSRRVPEPMRLDSGRLRWQGSLLELEDLNVALGASGVRRLYLAADWGAGDRFEVRTDAAVIEFGEVYPWLSLLPGLKGLRENISDIQGNVEVSGFGRAGRISDPLNWNLHADSRLNHMLVTTTFLEEPIRVRLGTLRAQEAATATPGGMVLRVEDLQASTGSNVVMTSGEIRLAPEDIALDLTLTAESIDWNEIQTLSDRLSRRQPTESRPVKGRISLHADAFKIDSYDFNPLVAEVLLTAGGTTVAIERADLCGIVLIGRLAFAHGRLNAYIVPVADGTLLDNTVTCLSEEKSMASGRFNLDGALQVDAAPAEFLKALTGNIEVISEDGRFLRSNLFAKILGLINITEIYRGTVPDLTGTELEYKRMKLSGEFRDGKLVVNGWTLDGPSLWMGARGEIDLIDNTLHLFVLVSPFKTVDRIINAIPGLRWVLGGRLVAIPMEARGELSDPEVIPMAPSAVGQSILDMLGRTLRLPLHIIQPLIPGLDESVDNDGTSIIKKK
ncbi:MAG: AsmA-like C-terminal domain-containing protein [Deltaproteobacteria bacterium]|nr:AsmA-like C-terminal domain-containing protein [Deltaproteobacteria bacterium]